MTRKRRAPAMAVGALCTALALALSGCGGDDQSPPTGEPGPDPTTASPQPERDGETLSPAPEGPPKVIGTVASGLAVPWGIAFLPDGSALVTERDTARVLHVVGARDAEVRDLGTVAGSSAEGEAGLLGIAVSPEFARDRAVFVYTTTEEDNRVLRMRFENGELGDPTPILTGIPSGFIHDGGRLVFGPDGLLYVSTGEIGDGPLAQDRDSLGGKVLRITTDGAPAPGNPFGSPVWSLGHRNVQGLAFDGAGRLWASEFGQNTWDELNLIQKGINYGWPEVEGRGARSGFRNPQVVWRTEEASPSGLAFADGHLWLASLRGERLWRIGVGGPRAKEPTDFFVGDYGRMRAVALAPDGNLWVTTSNHDGRGDPAPEDDRILLVSPTS